MYTCYLDFKCRQFSVICEFPGNSETKIFPAIISFLQDIAMKSSKDLEEQYNYEDIPTLRQWEKFKRSEMFENFTQQTFTCSKTAKETLEKGVKYAKS